MKTSTNALTKRWAESKGWMCETVQRFYGGKRHDAFGIVDSVILKGFTIVFAQNCSYGSLKAHRDAISGSEAMKLILQAGACVALLEWRRKKAKRGGKRIAREWWVREQHAVSAHTWGPLSDWEGPIDLYPKKTKP